MKRLLAAVALAAVLSGCASPIGTAEGAEWDRIILDGAEYIPVDEAPDGLDVYSGSDRGAYLGYIESGDETLRVYAIRGDEARDYLYVRWEWEGEIYVRRELTGE